MAFGCFVSSIRQNVRYLLILILPLLAYIVFWFFTAPGVRYFGPAMWIFAVCPALAFAPGDARIALTSWAATLVAAAIPLFVPRRRIPLVMEPAGTTVAGT